MRIGILTGGGDCPGLNAVIRAIVRTCDARYGSSVVGFQDGWRGLLENRRLQLQNDDRNDRLLAKGGTMLGTHLSFRRMTFSRTQACLSGRASRTMPPPRMSKASTSTNRLVAAISSARSTSAA